MKKSIPNKSSNRSFGIVFFIVFLVISLWPLKNQGDLRLWAISISAIFLFLGIINSKILSPLNRLWHKFGILLGKVVSPIVLGIIFFMVVTPTGLIMRALGKYLLKIKKDKLLSSYWVKYEKSSKTMKKQF